MRFGQTLILCNSVLIRIQYVIEMQQHISLSTEKQDRMARQITINASNSHRVFGKLLKRVYNSDEHFSQPQSEPIPLETLPPVMSLEEAFGSVTPINQPEDFATLREAAIEEHNQQAVANLRQE